MRTPTHQSALDAIPLTDRFSHTSRQAFRKRGTLVDEYTDWYITQNEYPHSHRGDIQLIAWYDGGNVSSGLETFFGSVRVDEKYKDLHCTHSALTAQSVPARLHLHLYTEKND